MANMTFLVQASSVSWAGTADLCINPIEGRAAIYHTVQKIYAVDASAEVILIAPEFDKNGQLPTALAELSEKVTFHYSHDDSPLLRMVSASNLLDDFAYLIRVDGLNFAFDADCALAMVAYAQEHQLDGVKFADDFPVQFTADIYRVGALRQLAEQSDLAPIYHIHPKYAFLEQTERYNYGYYPVMPRYSDRFLTDIRQRASQLHYVREGGQGKVIAAGDQLSFHYELAIPWVNDNMRVLDIACGAGFGSRLLAQYAKEVVGADIDAELISQLKKHKAERNIDYRIADAQATGFDKTSFDLIASMETIEHVPDDVAYVAEMARILKPKGILICSTPQNSLGHIPVNNQHQREYSLEQFVELIQDKFELEAIIGIKQGRVIMEGSPRGTNTLIVARKKS